MLRLSGSQTLIVGGPATKKAREKSVKNPYLRGVLAALLVGAAASAGLSGTAHAAAGASLYRLGGVTPMTQAQKAAAGYAKLDDALVWIAEAVKTAPQAGMMARLKQTAPSARFDVKVPQAVPAVLVEIVVRGNAETVQAQLRQLGVLKSSRFKNRVSAWVPADQLQAAAALDDIVSMRISQARAQVGSVTTQGDFFQRSEALRASTIAPGLTGRGVTVGILSDSFACTGAIKSYADDIASGDLPAGIEVLSELDGCNGGTDEGRAMAQLIYDVAPGTTLKFHSAFNGEADFANGILALAAAGANVIVDDVGYFDEPFFEDGIVAQAVDQVAAQGIPYFSSAGNGARDSYEASFQNSGVVGAAGTDIAGEQLLNFDTSGATVATVLPITIPADASILVYLQWDEAYASTGGAGALNALDICLTDRPSGPITQANIIFCTGASAIGDDPFLIFGGGLGNTTDFQGGLVIGLAGGVAPGRVKLRYDSLSLDQFATNSGTVQGHPAAAGAAAVGASSFRANQFCRPDLFNNFQLESFSSSGGTAILFDAIGQRLATPVVRQKPDFVAPDGGATTFFIQQIGLRTSTIPACNNAADAYNFFGTSAAAPHAAGVAALLRQAQPTLPPRVIFNALASTAIDMTAPGVDFDSGAGFIQADAALNAILPIVTLTPPLLNFGPVVFRQKTATQSVTLTNTGIGVLNLAGISLAGAGFVQSNNCPATLPAQGSCTITVTFLPDGVQDYSATLNVASNAGPASQSRLAISGSGTIPPGGGAFGFMLLPALAGLAWRRRRCAPCELGRTSD